MRILVDADGCPVVDSTIALATAHKIECLLLCDTSHIFEKDGAKTLTFSQGADSVDFALVNLIQPGDLVVTQDYGSRPMNITWKLDRSIPAKFLKKTNKLVVG